MAQRFTRLLLEHNRAPLVSKTVRKVSLRELGTDETFPFMGTGDGRDVSVHWELGTDETFPFIARLDKTRKRLVRPQFPVSPGSTKHGNVSSVPARFGGGSAR
jgi:hypothetical protein